MIKPLWMDYKCWQCLHYQPMINDNKKYTGRGICKESIPQVVVVGESVQEATIQMAGPKQKVKQVHIEAYQPVMAHDWSACGKFVLMPPEMSLFTDTKEGATA